MLGEFLDLAHQLLLVAHVAEEHVRQRGKHR
jgi:hypothetical protein